MAPVLLNKTKYDDFSFYNINQIQVTIEGSEESETLGWANSFEDAPDVATVTKSYENVEAKVRARGKGTGKISFDGHVRYPVLVKVLSMNDATMRDGTYAYGSPSIHKPFLLTGRVENEDGDIMLVAYPQAIVREAPTRSITPNAEEVKSMPITFSYMPDAYGYGRYEAKISDMDFPTEEAKEEYIENWLSKWDVSLVDPAV